MSRFNHRFTRFTISFALTLLVALSTVLPAFAINEVSLTLTAGTLTSSIADTSLTALSYSNSSQSRTGSMTLTADDSTGSGLGWNVTVLSSAFVYSGSAIDATNIPAVNFAITTANAPSMTAGQAIDATNGPKVPSSGATGTLDSAHKVIQANASYGLGTYTQALAVSLAVPAQSRAGTYTGTMTVTISAAP